MTIVHYQRYQSWQACVSVMANLC